MVGRYVRLVLQVVGALTLTIILLCAAAVPLLPGWLQYEEAPAKADYIIPLAGTYERLEKALDLYRQGYAPTVLLSNEQVSPASQASKRMTELGYPTIDSREVRARLIAHAGIPAKDVLEFGTNSV